jgi:hypothetical protein
MWHLLPRYWQVMIIMGAGVVGWEALCGVLTLVGGVTPSLPRYLSISATIIVTPAVFLIDRYWSHIVRWQPWLEAVTFPDLNGRWQGTFQSNWIDPATGLRIGPRDGTFEIKQTLLSVSVAMRTVESRSESTWCRLEPSRDAGVYRLRYLYENAPQARVADRSARHEGMCCLEFRPAEDATGLVGQYYTYRGTRGDIELRRQVECETQ